MMPTYYDAEKLMRMVYARKLFSSLQKIDLERSRIPDREPPRDPVPCQIRTTGAAAK